MTNKVQFTRTLKTWAEINPDNRDKLDLALDETMQAILDGKGTQQISGSANGLNFAGLMVISNFEFANILSDVIDMIDNGTPIKSGWSAGRII